MFISYFPQKHATHTHIFRTNTCTSDVAGSWRECVAIRQHANVSYLYLKYFAPSFAYYLLVQMHGAPLFYSVQHLSILHTHSFPRLVDVLIILCAFVLCAFHSITIINSRDDNAQRDERKCASRCAIILLFAGYSVQPYGLTNIIYSKMDKLFSHCTISWTFKHLVISSWILWSECWRNYAANTCTCAQHGQNAIDHYIYDLMTGWRKCSYALHKWNIYCLAFPFWLKSDIFATASERFAQLWHRGHSIWNCWCATSKCVVYALVTLLLYYY